MRVDAETTGQINNVAWVSANEPDPNLTNNHPEEPTDVIPEVDLAIVKSDNVDPVVPGENLVYTLVVTNNGPSDATGVVVEDTLPAEVSYVSGSASQGSVSAVGQIVTAQLGDLDVTVSGTAGVVRSA